MKLLTFNIWNVPGSTHRRARMAAIRAVLNASLWDVVLLQELWPTPQRWQFDDCGYPYAADIERPWQRLQNWLLAPAVPFGFPWIMDTGLRSLSRHPILDQRSLRYDLVPFLNREAARSAGNVIRRGALAIKIDADDIGPLWIVNTHLISSNRTGQNNPERWAQLHKLRRWMDTDLTGAPILLAGDLNMGPPLPGSRASLEEPDYWDRALAGPLGGFDPGPLDLSVGTWTEQKNAYVAADADRENARLDHVLAGPGLAVTGGQVVFDEPTPLPSGVTGHLSDHFGVEADIALSP